MASQVRTETEATYGVVDTKLLEEEILDKARKILYKRAKKLKDPSMTSPTVVREYLQVKLTSLEHEVFGVLWLDNRHRIQSDEVLFRGTIDGASVYPREVVKAALMANAAACILYHNHPSGEATPSQSDMRITEKLKTALGTIEVRILDHLEVGVGEVVSFAERNLL